jgi:hypothetical protein
VPDRNFHGIDALLFHDCGDFHQLGGFQPAAQRQAIGAIQLEDYWMRRPDPRSNRAENVAQHPDALLERSAEFVGASIGVRREELPQQVSMRGVDLDSIEAGALAAFRRVRKRLHNPRNLGRGKGPRTSSRQKILHIRRRERFRNAGEARYDLAPAVIELREDL